jgi:hypothetical protein
MALAPMSVDVVLGEFTEKEFGNYFHYSENDEPEFSEYPHKVWVGGIDQQYRYAEVKKTVAYIVTDEDEYGKPVVEKWLIKKNIAYS